MVNLEHPQPVPTHGVHGVVHELVRLDDLLAHADVLGVGRTVGMFVEPVPEAEVRAAGGVVVPDRVVRMCDPERGWRDVIVKQARASLDEEHEIILHDVSGLDAVLQENGATHDVIDDVELDEDVVRVVDVDCTVERLVECAAADVGAGHVAVDVEVDGVASESVRLPGVGELHVLDVTDHLFGTHALTAEHDLTSELVATFFLAETAAEASLGREHIYWKWRN